MKGDRARIQVLVLVAVFLVLSFSCASSWYPSICLLSVLFSYFVTLGVAYLVFLARSRPLHGPRLEGRHLPVHDSERSARITTSSSSRASTKNRDAMASYPASFTPWFARPHHLQLRHHHGGHLRLAHGRLPGRNETARLRPLLRRAPRYAPWCVRGLVPAFLILQQEGKFSPAGWGWKNAATPSAAFKRQKRLKEQAAGRIGLKTSRFFNNKCLHPTIC